MLKAGAGGPSLEARSTPCVGNEREVILYRVQVGPSERNQHRAPEKNKISEVIKADVERSYIVYGNE